MATRFIWLTCCCWASRIDPGRNARKPAPSTIRSLRLRHTTLCLAIPFRRRVLAPAVRCASLSMCCPFFGARRAYLTLSRLSRVTSEECLGSAPAPPPLPPGCPGGSGCETASLKELEKVTTKRMLCQVDHFESRGTSALPPHLCGSGKR